MKFFSLTFLLGFALVMLASLSLAQAQDKAINPTVLELVNKIGSENQVKLVGQARRVLKPLDMEIQWS